jgi:hypothetical protein
VEGAAAAAAVGPAADREDPAQSGTSHISQGCDLTLTALTRTAWTHEPLQAGVMRMDLRKTLRITAAWGVLVPSFAGAQIWAPVPADRLEIVTGPAQTVRTKASRQAAVRLLGRVRNNYGLRNAGRGYDLKVAFNVNSGGLTEEDGAWQLEEVFDPRQGLHWDAKSSAGYSITRIQANGQFFGEDTGGHIPLRLAEVRAAIFDPAPSAQAVARQSIRTSSATFEGNRLQCVLLADSPPVPGMTAGRRWDETEECIDPHSGLLRVHSQVPGRYFAYDYTNAPEIAGHMFPRKVSIYEAGKVITEISVQSLTEIPSADPSLFVPTSQMLARGRATALTGAEKIFHTANQAALPGGGTPHVVCVFGVVTASGELAEAHSLQPSDPASQAAVAAAQKMTFTPPPQSGARPRQHFVFVIESISPQ